MSNDFPQATLPKMKKHQVTQSGEMDMMEQHKIIKTWIIVKSQGFVPVTKQPPQGEIESMLISLIGIYPYAEIIICELTWNMDLQTQDGYEYIERAYLY